MADLCTGMYSDEDDEFDGSEDDDDEEGEPKFTEEQDEEWESDSDDAAPSQKYVTWHVHMWRILR